MRIVLEVAAGCVIGFLVISVLTALPALLRTSLFVGAFLLGGLVVGTFMNSFPGIIGGLDSSAAPWAIGIGGFLCFGALAGALDDVAKREIDRETDRAIRGHNADDAFLNRITDAVRMELTETESRLRRDLE